MSSVKRRGEYHVAIISFSPHEQAAVVAMLDEVHENPVDFPQDARDSISYLWGSVSGNDVVLVLLCNNSQLYGAKSNFRFRASLPSVEWALLVTARTTTGSFASQKHVRLGDVVVGEVPSCPFDAPQHDLYNPADESIWTGIICLDQRAGFILRALNALKSEQDLVGLAQIYQYLRDARQRHPHWAHNCAHSGPGKDQLFRADYAHQFSFSECENCDQSRTIMRPLRESPDFEVHYDLNTRIDTSGSSTGVRKRLASIVRKMHIPGIPDSRLDEIRKLPCLSVHGISDYGDSHKNDIWKQCACSAAATYSKVLLTFLKPSQSKCSDSTSTKTSQSSTVVADNDLPTNDSAASNSILRSCDPLAEIDAHSAQITTTFELDASGAIEDFPAWSPVTDIPVMMEAQEERDEMAMASRLVQTAWIAELAAYQPLPPLPAQFPEFCPLETLSFLQEQYSGSTFDAPAAMFGDYDVQQGSGSMYINVDHSDTGRPSLHQHVPSQPLPNLPYPALKCKAHEEQHDNELGRRARTFTHAASRPALRIDTGAPPSL